MQVIDFQIKSKDQDIEKLSKELAIYHAKDAAEEHYKKNIFKKRLEFNDLIDEYDEMEGVAHVRLPSMTSYAKQAFSSVDGELAFAVDELDVNCIHDKKFFNESKRDISKYLPADEMKDLLSAQTTTV